jgi:hypothetical protein
MTQKKWPELIPQIEEWLIASISGSTGYIPTELTFGKPNLR